MLLKVLPSTFQYLRRASEDAYIYIHNMNYIYIRHEQTKLLKYYIKLNNNYYYIGLQINL